MDPNNTTAVIDPTRHPSNRIPPPRGYALSGKIMLSAIVVLFTIVLLILFIHLYVRWHVYRRDSRRSRRRRSPLIFTAGGDGTPPAPVPRGLDPKVVNSLSVLIFSSEDLDGDDESGDVAAECAVCLSEFEEGEKVRVLPRCDHRFHIGCIDMWFGSHNSCPLCRSAVEAPPPESETPPPPAQQCADRAAGTSSESGNPEVSIEIRGREEELGLGFGSEPASGRKSRILAIKRYLYGDLRLSRGEGDLERGEAAERAPPAAPSSAVAE